MFKAAIFDWDGVVVNSNALHTRSWEMLGVSEGLVLPEDHFERGFGSRNDRVISEIMGWTEDPVEIERLANKKEQMYRNLLELSGVEFIPGVLEFLKVLYEMGIPCAIGSSTPRKNLDVVLNKYELNSYFAAISCGEDVERGKPHPDVFLGAAEKLKCSYDQCVVFEDAPVGVKAGLTAGMKVVGISTTHKSGILNDAHLVFQDFTHIQVPHITELFKGTN